MKNGIYVVVILFLSCQMNSKKADKVAIAIKFESIHLLDTFKNTLTLGTATSIETAYFRPFYIGPYRDTIALNYWSGKHDYFTPYHLEYKHPKLNELVLYVDTAQNIGSPCTFIPPPPPPPTLVDFQNMEEKFESKIVRGEFLSFPVFIKNVAIDTLNVGIGLNISLLLEAKDSLDNWKPIQEFHTYYCGMGLKNIHLPPDELIITSCKLYEGDHETKMRIAFRSDHTIYSNEFVATMNYRQFNESKKELR